MKLSHLIPLMLKSEITTVTGSFSSIYLNLSSPLSFFMTLQLSDKKPLSSIQEYPRHHEHKEGFDFLETQKPQLSPSNEYLLFLFYPTSSIKPIISMSYLDFFMARSCLLSKDINCLDRDLQMFILFGLRFNFQPLLFDCEI